MASKAAAARAAEQKLSGTQALRRSAAGQLGSAQQELTRLQEQIGRDMRVIYDQQVHLPGPHPSFIASSLPCKKSVLGQRTGCV